MSPFFRKLLLSVISTSVWGANPPTTGDWTRIPAHGPPAQIYAYDKTIPVSSRKLHCIWGGYHQIITSERNEALVCWSYATNTWVILQNSGAFGTARAGEQGHSVSVFAYMASRDALVYQVEGSGSNSQQQFLANWWWFDIAGLVGLNKQVPQRAWLVNSATPLNQMAFDDFDDKGVLYSASDTTGGAPRTGIYDPVTNDFTFPTVSGTPPPTDIGFGTMAYNSADHAVYYFGGVNGSGNKADIYKMTCATNACTAVTWTKLTTTCNQIISGHCVGNSPRARQGAGMAYTTVDSVFLMVGGGTAPLSGTAYDDTFTFDPATLVWQEQNPTNKYFISNVSLTWDRLDYDADSNVFLLLCSPTSGSIYLDNGGSWNSYNAAWYAFPLSAATGNYERTSTSYTPTAGSLNLVTPTTMANSNTTWSQSYASGAAIAVSGSTIYLGATETGSAFGSTAADMHHPYVLSTPNSGTYTYYPGGATPPTVATAVLAIDPEPAGNASSTDADERLQLAFSNSKLWAAWSKWNTNNNSPAGGSGVGYARVTNGGNGSYATAPSVTITGNGCAGVTATSSVDGGYVVGVTVTGTGGSGCSGTPTVAFSGGGGSGAAATAFFGISSSAWAKFWDGASWVGGQVGCFFTACSGANLVQYPTSMISSNSIPTLGLVEWNRNANPAEGYGYVAQWVNGVWGIIGARLNLGAAASGTRLFNVALTTDGTNPSSCFAEEKDATGGLTLAIITTPQVRCRSYGGVSWAQIGPASFNQTATNYAYDPVINYLSGGYYVSWVERTQSGNTKLYACLISGATCPLIGGGALNIDATNGNANHATLSNDGTNLYLGWEEAVLGSHVVGHMRKWNGSAFSLVGSAIAADTTNGSIQDLNCAVVGTSPTCTFTEEVFGNLRQLYVMQFDGSGWTQTLGSVGPTISTTSPLPDGYQTAAYSQSIVATAVPASYTCSITTGSLPTGLSLSNASNGCLVSGTPSVVQVANFTVKVANNISPDATRAFQITVNTRCTITSSSIAGGTINIAYSQTVPTSGCASPAFSIVSGALPSGMSIGASTGTISGTTTLPGNYAFTVAVTDVNAVPNPTTQPLLLVVGPPPAPAGASSGFVSAGVVK